MTDRNKNGKRKRHREPTRIDEAAGGIVVAKDEGGVRFVLIATPFGSGERWSLPKGHFKKHESREQAALREVHEETGLIVRIRAPVETIDYWFIENGIRYHKFVHYFVMESLGGDLADHDHEVIEARWFEWDDGLKHMAYGNERKMLESSYITILGTLGDDERCGPD